MNETLQQALTYTSVILNLILAYVAFMRNKKKDDETDGKHSGTMLTEIGYIKSGIDDIKKKQEKQDEQHLEIVSRLCSVEASAKQAHKRIDSLEGSRPERE